MVSPSLLHIRFVYFVPSVVLIQLPQSKIFAALCHSVIHISLAKDARIKDSAIGRAVRPAPPYLVYSSS